MPVSANVEIITIANGQANSGVINLQGSKILGIILPTLDSGTVKVQVSHDAAGTFVDVKDTTGASLAFPVGTGAFAMDADYLARFMGYPFAKIVTSVNQTALRTIQVIKARE